MASPLSLSHLISSSSFSSLPPLQLLGHISETFQPTVEQVWHRRKKVIGWDISYVRGCELLLVFSEQEELLIGASFKFIFWLFLYHAHLWPWEPQISLSISASTLLDVASYSSDFLGMGLWQCLHWTFQSPEVGVKHTEWFPWILSYSSHCTFCFPRNAWWPHTLFWHLYISKDPIDLSAT